MKTYPHLFGLKRLTSLKWQYFQRVYRFNAIPKKIPVVFWGDGAKSVTLGITPGYQLSLLG